MFNIASREEIDPAMGYYNINIHRKDVRENQHKYYNITSCDVYVLYIL